MFPDLGRCGSINDLGRGVRWDAGALAVEVVRRTMVLQQHRIGPGAVVAISHSGSAPFFADLLAVWSVGAAAACLDSALTELELQTVIGFIKPAALLVCRSNVPDIPSVPVLDLASSRPLKSTAGSRQLKDFDPDWPALILFTSGTTGNPKGVVLTYRALQTRIELNAAAIGAAALRRTLVTLPTHFGHGLIGNALTPLLSGGDIVLGPPGILLGDQLGRVIDKHSISFLSSVPALWNLAKRSSDPPAGNSLIRVHVGSAPLSAKLWSEIVAWSRAEVVNCYGMTETANWVAGASSRSDSIADGLVGRTWGGAAAVMDSRGMMCRKGEGEIVIQSPCLMSGYFNRPDLTANVITDGWFRTGDRGAVDELGRIWLTGRIKDEINRAGFKVQPAEIDMLLEKHPAIAEACIFAIPDHISGEVIAAAVRLARPGATNADELQAWCRKRLRRNAVPERWFIVDSIPRNARGKVNRDAVRQKLVTATEAPKIDPGQRHASVASGGERQWPSAAKKGSEPSSRDRVQVAVERAWTRVLGQRSFRANTPWNLAGGDSIGAMRLWLEIEQQLSMQLPLEHLQFDIAPTDLVRTIERLVESGGERPSLNHQRRRQPPIFFMPSAHGDDPLLAQFRAAFNGGIRFEVIQYPQLDELVDGGGGFDVVADFAVAQVLAKCGDEACYLMGYSYGGFVAWEVARRLIQAKRQVDFLGLLDTRRSPKQPQNHKNAFAKAIEYIGRTWRHPQQAYRDILWWLVELLTRHYPLSAVRRVDNLVSSLPGGFAFAFHLELLARLRANALERWKIEPLDVHATLFRSDEWSKDAPDHGWGALCSQLTVLPIGGGHRTLLDPKFRKTLCDQFFHAVERARVRSQGTLSKTGS